MGVYDLLIVLLSGRQVHISIHYEWQSVRSKDLYDVCFDLQVDRFISGYIADGSLWEAEICMLFQDLLDKDQEIGLIDVGANIGML